MNEAELITEYAKCWNNLDVSYIEEILADDLEYSSQWVFETMHSKKNYLDYLKGKFETFKRNNSLPEAQIGYFKKVGLESDKPCIVLTNGDVKVSLLLQVNDGKIKRIDMVGIPNPEKAILFDYIPK